MNCKFCSEFPALYRQFESNQAETLIQGPSGYVYVQFTLVLFVRHLYQIGHVNLHMDFFYLIILLNFNL